MTLTEKDVKRFSLIALILVLTVLVFLVIKPVLLTTIGALILAYIFFPLYKKILQFVKFKNLSASLVTILATLIIVLPLVFLLPLLLERVFVLFQASQQLDIGSYIANLIPTASEQLTTQIITATDGAISGLTSAIMNSLVSMLLDFPVFTLHLFLFAFIFFYALRDADKLKEFVSGLSPLSRTQEKALVKQFEGITNSVIYGQIVLGFFQGILAGIAFLIFGVPHALILTVLAVILSIIPIIGPGLVYLPVTFFLLIVGNPFIALAYFLYNIVLVSPFDNILRAHWLSRKASISQVIALIGMLGGIFIFGILGLILGPLILAYFLTFLNAYKEKTLSSFFSS